MTDQRFYLIQSLCNEATLSTESGLNNTPNANPNENTTDSLFSKLKHINQKTQQISQ